MDFHFGGEGVDRAPWLDAPPQKVLLTGHFKTNPETSQVSMGSPGGGGLSQVPEGGEGDAWGHGRAGATPAPQNLIKTEYRDQDGWGGNIRYTSRRG